MIVAIVPRQERRDGIDGQAASADRAPTTCLSTNAAVRRRNGVKTWPVYRTAPIDA
jgi:hypothetical protein